MIAPVRIQLRRVRGWRLQPTPEHRTLVAAYVARERDRARLAQLAREEG